MKEFINSLLDRLSIPAFLAVVVTLGFFALIILMFFHSPPSESEKTVAIMLTAVSTSVGVIIGYHFGSSSGSAKKTEMLNKSEEK